MMRQLRQNTKIILWIVVVAFITTIFAVWGMDLNTGSPSSDPSLLGKVNGIPITRAHYRSVYEQLTAEYRKLSPSGQLTYTQMEMVDDQVWDNIIISILTEQKIEELGITVSNEEIVNYLRNTPPPEIQQYFMDDQGQFNFQAYQQALNNPEADWTSLENLARQRLPRLKLNQYLTTQIHVSQDDVRRAYEESNIDLVARYVEYSLNNEDTGDYVPGETEIEAYYNEHIDDYTEGEKAAIEVVAIEIKPDQYDREDALYALTNIRDKILDGEAFEELAKIYSERITAETGGETGWLRNEPAQPEIYKTLAALADNEMSEPVESDNGFYLLKRLGQRTGEDGAVEFNALEIFIELRAGSGTYDSLMTMANTLRDRAEAAGLQPVAEEMDLEVITPKPVYQNFPFEGLGFVPSLNKFAFGNETGTLSSVLRDETHFYICRLVERIPAAAKPIAEVKDAISDRLIYDRKKDMAWRKADGFYRQTASLGFEKTGAAHNLAIQTPDTFQVADNVIPFGPRSLFAKTALGLNVGAVSPPVEVREAYYVIQLVSRSNVDEEDLLKSSPGLFNRLYQTKLERFVAFWYDDLKENSKIEDYRNRL